MLLHPSLISKQIFVSSDISFPWHLPKVFASHVAFVLNSLGGKKDREECAQEHTQYLARCAFCKSVRIWCFLNLVMLLYVESSIMRADYWVVSV